jgi:alpha-glucosidase
VQDEVLRIMSHWFDLGVDGLRLDVVNFYMQDPALRDNPPSQRNDLPANPYYLQQHLYDRSRPENLPFIARMRAEADRAGDRMLLGEISCDWQIDRMAEYTSTGRLHTAYSFELLGPVLSGIHLARAVTEAGAGGAWPCWAFSNHDVIRVASRWGATGNQRRTQMLQALLLSLRGSICLYQGEELGLSHSEVPRHRLQDPEALRFWPNHRGRDGARTPMPWTDQGVALGFSESEGWLPAAAEHASLAISLQTPDPRSNFNHIKALLKLRRATPALRLGEFEVLEATETAIIFRRSHAGESLTCAFNFGNRPIAFAHVGLTLAGAAGEGNLAPDGYVILKEQA